VIGLLQLLLMFSEYSTEGLRTFSAVLFAVQCSTQTHIME
jgi:hypothetical protein